jgi:hypothetical protein
VVGLVDPTAQRRRLRGQGIPALQEWLGKPLTTPWQLPNALIPDERRRFRAR